MRKITIKYFNTISIALGGGEKISISTLNGDVTHDANTLNHNKSR